MKKIIYDINDVANVLQLSKNSTYTLFHRKDFPALKIGNKLCVRIDHFSQWLEEQKQPHNNSF